MIFPIALQKAALVCSCSSKRRSLCFVVELLVQELCQKTDSANIVSEMLKLVDDASVARWLCGLTTVNEIGQCYLVFAIQIWDSGEFDHHPIGYLY